MGERRYSMLDRLLIGVAQGLPAPRAQATGSPRGPVAAQGDPLRREAANLMRVNHAGEVAAQGLYHGQALTARSAQTRQHLLEAAGEEQQHLQWCEQRLQELGDRPSRLRPLWYAGSVAMGAVAGLFGDRWSLGFVAETERQVAEHLDEHLQRLPAQDARSREILQAMRRDEQRHGTEAENLGGAPLPVPVRGLMRQIARVMKAGAYRF
ncbi:2-polyprenyl-3-methyl-6-methoxy-1,4-benzoquinone monooxygenase [Panacagrimonas sp.]|uniref:2-polyprenyl-3-methyl-6-methoxy-1,4-benzoquinone monooxygenase n=1 Tax=Panacagrimonas sp. TaxID=2480088 RepID=UPI003B52DAAD